MDIIKGYKAFDKNWKCRDFQFSVGKNYEIKRGQLELCSNGFHFSELPHDVLNYYCDVLNQKYAIVEASGEIIKSGDKSCCRNIKIIREITFNELISLVLKPKSSTTGDSSHSSTTGYSSHSSTTGDRSHSSTTGDRSHSSTTGDSSHSSTTGDNSVSVSIGINSRAKAENGFVVIANWILTDGWNIKDIHTAKIGGKILNTIIDSDHWYWFEDGILMSEKVIID